MKQRVNASTTDRFWCSPRERKTGLDGLVHTFHRPSTAATSTHDRTVSVQLYTEFRIGPPWLKAERWKAISNRSSALSKGSGKKKWCCGFMRFTTIAICWHSPLYYYENDGDNDCSTFTNIQTFRQIFCLINQWLFLWCTNNQVLSFLLKINEMKINVIKLTSI